MLGFGVLPGDYSPIQPPVAMPMPTGFYWMFLVMCAIPFIAFLVFSLWVAARHRMYLPLLLMASGLVAVGWEPILDVLGNCWFPDGGPSTTLFTSLGRPMPMFVPFAYGWFLGAFALWFLPRFYKGGSFQSLVRGWLILGVVNIVLESPAVIADVYIYYGDQPLNLWGFPLWWPICNALSPMVAAFLLYKLMPHLSGWRMLGVVLIIPIAMGIAYGTTTWPVFMTINTDLPYALKTVAALVSIGLVFLALKVMSMFTVDPLASAAEREPVNEETEASLVGSEARHEGPSRSPDATEE
jgi:hypothetical protein